MNYFKIFEENLVLSVTGEENANFDIGDTPKNIEKSDQAPEPKAAMQRLKSLDVFRGYEKQQLCPIKYLAIFQG